MRFNKTMIAPTPSGFLHIGNVLSFSLTAALARMSGAKIFLRIDDLDRDRVTAEYVEDIFETLRFLGIPWDEGPGDAMDFERSWSQVHRMGLYREALERLRASGAVFACACSRSQLQGTGGYPGTCRDKGLSLDAPGVNWRLRTGGGRTVRMNEVSVGAEDDATVRMKEGDGGAVEAVLPAEMRDFVVRKKDGYPAYQLASVIDDVSFGVDLIVRGEDLLPSTLAQLYLADVLGAAAFAAAGFFHHPLLTEGGEKLSKSAGATSIRYLRGEGHSPADIYSLIARSQGMEEPVGDWERLATLLFARGYGPGR